MRVVISCHNHLIEINESLVVSKLEALDAYKYLHLIFEGLYSAHLYENKMPRGVTEMPVPATEGKKPGIGWSDTTLL